MVEKKREGRTGQKVKDHFAERCDAVVAKQGLRASTAKDTLFGQQQELVFKEKEEWL
jgi:hypothetical protein